MNIFVINGKGAAGKDTFVEFIDSISFGEIQNVSSVDEIKNIAKKYFGWGGEKTKKWRKILSDLKDIQTEGCDGPFKYMCKCLHLKHKYTNAQFFHIREPKEIKKFVDYCKNNFGEDSVNTIYIKKPEENYFGNHADDNCEKYEYDIIIDNNGSLDDLKDLAYNFYLNYM